MNKITRIFIYTIFTTAFSASVQASTNLTFNADTSNLFGTTGTLYIDFISGGNTTINIATLSSFSSDGVLGGATPQGDVIGSLPSTVTLNTNSFFNELAQSFTFGNKISFNLNFTQNGPDPSGTPDAFSLFVADASNNPIPTTDPTGSNALFLFNIDGTSTGNLNTYTLPNGLTPWQVTTVAAIPVPSAIWFFISGILGLKLASRPRQQQI